MSQEQARPEENPAEAQCGKVLVLLRGDWPSNGMISSEELSRLLSQGCG